ncbi:hypothetical protein EVAR_94849_1 [Eumeta japonica]|uniref:Uncharacterized protein n=1 Tax=Eumeta variegata TaxID=151549 RepID=A0A4C1V9Q9_EUMVA|nr:hypothetical protein EVAR_94849_1 [Eumeta japonica]
MKGLPEKGQVRAELPRTASNGEKFGHRHRIIPFPITLNRKVSNSVEFLGGFRPVSYRRGRARRAPRLSRGRKGRHDRGMRPFRRAGKRPPALVEIDVCRYSSEVRNRSTSFLCARQLK